jgi:hypothetical protein
MSWMVQLRLADKGKSTEKDCPNNPEPTSAYVVVYNKVPLVLCKECGPEFQRRQVTDNK